MRWFRGLLLFLFGGLLGVALGFAIGIFVFPYLFPPPIAAETLTAAERARPVATGIFIHANPMDPIHWGRGRVSVYEGAVFLEADFEVGPGPAFHVYLVPAAKVRTDEAFEQSTPVDLGGLRSFRGSQRYAIPAGTDLSKHQSVVIWCKTFSVLISPADLTPAAPQ